MRRGRESIEVVLASNKTCRDAHRALYHFTEDHYVIVEEDLLKAIASVTEDKHRVHITGPWADIIRIATWKSKPGRGDVLLLLRNSGIEGEELIPFRNAESGDIFPWLYYGRKVDVLRRICRSAKANAEKHLKNGEAKIYCHLISEDTKSIVASSL